ncbi:hypothetical protein ACOMHN_016623 [Nucella lapillus]
MELGILHNSPPSTKRGCRAGRLHRLWHGLPPAPWPCTRSQHHSVPSRNLHPLMVPPFLQPHPDLQSAVGNAPLSSKHPAQLPTTDCLLSIISPMGGQPSDAPALSPPSPLQQGGQSSNAPALSPPSPLPQGGQPIALALSPPSPPPQGGQPSDAPGLSPSSSTLLLCPSDYFKYLSFELSVCSENYQNFYDIGFRIVEFGVALWFPCVLWNCGRPEELWVLNPKRIFRSFDFQRRRKLSEKADGNSRVVGEGQPISALGSELHYDTFDAVSEGSRADCWICYDPERRDAGALIQPCGCKGDVATVHHDCLKKWLVESATNEASPECRVCGERYKLEAHYWVPKGLRPRHWLQTFLAVLLLTGLPFAAYTACHSMTSASSYLQILIIGVAILMELFFFRMFVLNIRSSCQRVKVATMKIAGKEVAPCTRTTSQRAHNHTTNVRVTVHQEGQGHGPAETDQGRRSEGQQCGESICVHVTAESSVMCHPSSVGDLTVCLP